VSLPSIAVVIGTTRQGRFSERPAQWLLERARKRDTARFDMIDLRDHPLPFFDEPRSPMWGPLAGEAERRWAATLAGYDGFVFVTAEYNHGIPAVLKNALDHAYAEFVRKPAAFVSYGGVGGARGVEQLRLVTIELQMAPVRHAVHIGLTEFLGMLQQGKDFADYPHLGQSADTLLDDLLWWTRALKTARDAA